MSHRVHLHTDQSLRCQDTQVQRDGNDAKAGCTLTKTLAEEEAGDQAVTITLLSKQRGQQPTKG